MADGRLSSLHVGETQEEGGAPQPGVDAVINWARKNSIWPLPLGLSCCGIEFMANADEAAKVFLHEDGFQTGLLYCEQRPSWPPLSDKAADESALAGLAASFRV